MSSSIVSPLSKDFVSQMRDAVKHVASLFPTAIISGRSRDKVQAVVVHDKQYYFFCVSSLFYFASPVGLFSNCFVFVGL